MTSVVVVGGGYGGIAVAKALDEVADVVLVDPKDSFEHNVAALRALVDPSWSSRIHFSYARRAVQGGRKSPTPPSTPREPRASPTSWRFSTTTMGLG